MKILSLLLFTAAAHAATFGTVVTIVGEPSDLVLDEARGRLYVVNSSQNRVEVYSTAQKQLLAPMAVDSLPISAALSRSGKYLYVTSYSAGVLDILDLDSGTVATRVSLPSAPEGVAVGADERVLISSPGTGTTASPQNTLLLYDPFLNTVGPIPTTLPGPTTPTTSQGVSRSRLIATPDGALIIGLNNPSTTTRQIFVYETASSSVLRSRTVTNISSVLSVSPDGSRFMAGLSMFETSTLMVMAQQNAANSAYPFPSNVNFNTQTNQGGSVFAPDGSTLYTAFNVAPVQTPAAQPNVSQMMLNDPDNLLIKLALQLPQNLIGRMVISGDGANIYALSQSGFTVIPVSTIYNNPIALPATSVVMVTHDQCGVTADTATVAVQVQNAGKGRFTATAAVQSTGPTANIGLGGGGLAGFGGAGGFQGPGGGPPGGGFPIVLPGGGGTITLPPTTNPTTGIPNVPTQTQQTAITGSAPTLVTKQNDTGTEFDFTFSSSLASAMGTAAPSDFVVTAPQAINIPPLIRVFQNARNSEATGTVMPVTLGSSTAEGLMDMAADNPRQRLYIANSGLNRVEVFDIAQQQFLEPIKVGQLPHSLALAPDGNTLYVANSGGESISIIDLNQRQVTGKVRFPMLVFNASAALVTPSLIAASMRGLQMVMSDGSLWKVMDGAASPRGTSSVITATTITSPRSLVATPDGQYIMLLGGDGKAYLYDANTDDYVTSEQVVSTPIQGYFGPVGAAPNGRYFLANGMVLDTALTQSSNAGTTTSGTSTVSRPVSAVYAINATTFARFVQPVRSSATAAVTTSATIEVVDVATGALRGSSPALEGPLSTQVGTQRANINPRTMAVDASISNAYLLTASGLSIIPLTTAAAPAGPGGPGGPGGIAPPGATTSTRPQVNASNGVTAIASYQSALAPGSVISIFGQNLASSTAAASAPLPKMMGGTCVTIDNTAMPLVMTSPTQINVQLPPTLTAAKHTLVVRSVDQKAASNSQSITVSKYAPAVLIDPDSGLAAIYDKNGKLVSKSNPAVRDQSYTIYATGLGVTTGGKVTAGDVSPSNPLAVTAAVSVYFGDPGYSQAPVIVNWSGLVPGMIGLYQINVTVPGTHMKGDALPVTLKIGGVSSPTSGSTVPTVAAN